MCGLAGYFSKSNGQNLRNKLPAAIEEIQHRGPDAKQFWYSTDNRVGFGHARLSIVDLAGGTQPLSNEDGSIQIVVNGELYDYKKIKTELQRDGYVFKTETDSEILIPLYQKYGLACVDHLIGEFAFVIYDKNLDRIVAGRDRFGIKPLFYYQNENEILFGSEIKSILQMGVSARWNLNQVVDTEYAVLSRTETLFKDVYAIEPGHFVIWKDGKLEKRKYWDISYPSDDMGYKKTPDHTRRGLIAEFQTLLKECVKVRLHGDVPVSAYLSGGIDSTSVVALMAQMSQTKVTAFTVCFDQEGYDESHLSEEVANFTNVEYVPIDVTQESLINSYKKAIWHNEAMVLNTQGVAKFLLSKKVNELGYKVVLTGEGSDEQLAGYAFFREDLIRNVLPLSDGNEKELLEQLVERNKVVAHGFLSSGESHPYLDEVEKSFGYVPSMWKVGFRAKSNALNLWRDSAREHLQNRNPYIELLKTLDLNRLEGVNPINKSLYLWAKTNLPGMILTYLGDRMEMAHSVEGRLPFLDHRLAEFAQKLPIDLKIYDMTEKYILREAMKGLIPDVIYQRQKHPFIAPPVVGARENGKTPMHRMMEDYFNSAVFKKLPFYDEQKILKFLEELPDQPLRERASADLVLNRALSACFLAENFALSA